jgi:hypothetical protein
VGITNDKYIRKKQETAESRPTEKLFFDQTHSHFLHFVKKRFHLPLRKQARQRITLLWQPVRVPSAACAAPGRTRDGAVARTVAHAAVVRLGRLAILQPLVLRQKPCRPHARFALVARAIEALGALGAGREFVPAAAFEMRDAVERPTRALRRLNNNFGQEGPGTHLAATLAAVKRKVRRAFGGCGERVPACAFELSP